MHIESQNGILAPGAFQPGNLSLQLELRRRRFPRLLVFLWPRLLGLRFMSLLQNRRDRTLAARCKALIFWGAVSRRWLV
jgi:hypothetical protein